jgi:acyl-coenzyme A synthetase/AMP-(fatty) acid ligase
MSGDAAPAIVTPERMVDRGTLGGLAAAVEIELRRSVLPGTPLGIWVDDPVDFAACIIAALAVRAEAFIISPGATPSRANELRAIEGGAAVLCDATRETQLTGGTARACGPGLLLVEYQAALPAVSPHDQGAVHFYTSGTDGQPKGVVRTKQSLELEESTVGSHLGMRPGSAVLCAVPVTHGYGYTAGLFAPMSFGGTSIVARPRMAASLARVLTERKPEIVVAVPAQYAAWSALRRTYTGPLPRLWLCGGAPLPAAVRSRFQETWGSVISEQYGLHECGAVTVDLDGAECLGRPYPGVTVVIDSDTEGDTAEVGEVVVDAPYGPLGYIGGLGAGGESPFTPEGVRTGDAGWLDADGRLHLLGRRAHQLNVRGQKVAPAEIERAFWALDGVHDVAIVGVDRAEGDQWIAAFVVCADSISDDALRQATVDLDGYKRPQRVTRLAALPKNAAGKTDLEALRGIARSAVTDG